MELDPLEALRNFVSNFACNRWVQDLLKTFTDPSVDELCLNGIRSLSVHQKAGRQVATSPFSDPVAMVRACQEFAHGQGMRLDPFSPSAGGTFEGGFRWHCLIPPACGREGALLTIRRHRFADLKVADFSMTPLVRERLQALAADRSRHILFCGPTGSGKTSLLLACLKTYAWEERVVIIEEMEELPLLSPHWLSLLSRKPDTEGRGSIRPATLIEESLRLRPDRLVVGEMRTAESLVFFESITLGHGGSMATVHASHHTGVRERLSSLLLFRGKVEEEKFTNRFVMENLWCVFLERGHPPRIVSVEPFR